MKIIFFGLSITFFLFACQKRDNEQPLPPNPLPNQNNMDSGCKACEYYPVCDGSYYMYLESNRVNATDSANILSTDTLRSFSDTIMNGFTYKVTKRISSRRPKIEYMNCNNGVYSIIERTSSGLGVSFIWLKANDPVGTTWINTLGDVKYTMSIEGKGLMVQMGGKNYSEVIKVKMIINGRGSLYDGYFYYAKGVGNIKYELGNWNFDANWYNRMYLQSHFIP